MPSCSGSRRFYASIWGYCYDKAVSYTHLDVYKRQVLGRPTAESTQYGKQDYTVAPIEGLELADQLHDACLLYTSRCV